MCRPEAHNARVASQSLGSIRIAKRRDLRDPFLAAWTRFRLRRAAMGLGLAGFFAVGAPLVGLQWAPSGAESAYVLVAIVCSIPVAIGLLAAIPPFECPACERPFSRRTRREITALRNCAHCGIAIGTPEHSHY